VVSPLVIQIVSFLLPAGTSSHSYRLLICGESLAQPWTKRTVVELRRRRCLAVSLSFIYNQCLCRYRIEFMLTGNVFNPLEIQDLHILNRTVFHSSYIGST
jgi:hypothetical protein